MDNRDNIKSRVITRDTMCVIEKQVDDSLRIIYYPISFDARIMDSLCALAAEMLDWEREQGKELLETIELAGVELCDNRGVSAVIWLFRDAIQNIRHLAEIESAVSLSHISVHSDWKYATGIYRLSEYAGVIRNFTVDCTTIEACQAHLSDSDYRSLQDSFRVVTIMQPILLSMLDRYEEAFFDYVEKAEMIHPELFKTRNYCQNIVASYGDAELDYTMMPGNQCAVERIDEYYRACVLDNLYDDYEAAENIIAYAHRKLGFFEYTIELDPKCNLNLLHETNFGFGRAVYFRSTLNYKGVSAVNVSSLIFFDNARKVSFSNCTFDYDVDEKSFAKSFEKAVQLYSEYHALGEVGFVDKYFRKSLKNLSELLRIVASTDTFLQVTTLERLDSLTSGSRNILLPDEGFRDIEFDLNVSEKKAADKFAAAVVSDMAANESEKNDRAEMFAELLSDFQDLSGSKSLESSNLQLIVKKDLLRNYVINKILNLLPNGSDVAVSSKVVSAIKELIPPDKGIYTKKYNGYDLINMRIEKAFSAIRPIARLRKIAELTNFESIIDSIVATCRQISHQAENYISEEIDPDFSRMKLMRAKTEDQLKEIEKQIESSTQREDDTNWIEKQKRELEAHLLTLDRKISKLDDQRNTLQKYICAVQSI